MPCTYIMHMTVCIALQWQVSYLHHVNNKHWSWTAFHITRVTTVLSTNTVFVRHVLDTKVFLHFIVIFENHLMFLLYPFKIFINSKVGHIS